MVNDSASDGIRTGIGALVCMLLLISFSYSTSDMSRSETLGKLPLKNDSVSSLWNDSWGCSAIDSTLAGLLGALSELPLWSRAGLRKEVPFSTLEGSPNVALARWVDLFGSLALQNWDDPSVRSSSIMESKPIDSAMAVDSN